MNVGSVAKVPSLSTSMLVASGSTPLPLVAVMESNEEIASGYLCGWTNPLSTLASAVGSVSSAIINLPLAAVSATASVVSDAVSILQHDKAHAVWQQIATQGKTPENTELYLVERNLVYPRQEEGRGLYLDVQHGNTVFLTNPSSINAEHHAIIEADLQKQGDSIKNYYLKSTFCENANGDTSNHYYLVTKEWALNQAVKGKIKVDYASDKTCGNIPANFDRNTKL